ncbi:MAG: sodium:proton antiporter NhaD [Muribaculaceae bacterium]|nr:sodium:proton antiporter NhaD [Muribaculaceae bacterium]
MLTTFLIIFLIGYLAIALEHPIKIDKTASALILGMVLWICYAFLGDSIVPIVNGEHFNEYLNSHPELQGESLAHQTLSYILNVDIVEHLGDITQTLLFLIGAMTIVELVDVHGGFRVITDRIVTRNKRKLLWIICVTTFFMSAILDNLTTTIVMLMLLRKLIDDQKTRWLYAGAIVIAANSGGAWSPIGDVTTIMLWVKGNVTAQALISYVLIPSIVSMVIPLLLMGPALKGELPPISTTKVSDSHITPGERKCFFTLGVGGLIFVPIFKTITHLPPFVGMLLVLGLLWIVTEIFYNRKKVDKSEEYRIPKVISRIDMPSILFFLGILMAVAVLQSTGVLSWLANELDTSIHDVYVINTVLGVLSSIVDNVPLVAGVMGMYPISPVGAEGYAANFVVDGTFWELLSYCAGVGGSILIIGSAAGVIAMGLEKINFGWYLKRFSWLALIGYLSGIGVYLLEHILF